MTFHVNSNCRQPQILTDFEDIPLATRRIAIFVAETHLAYGGNITQCLRDISRILLLALLPLNDFSLLCKTCYVAFTPLSERFDTLTQFSSIIWQQQLQLHLAR